MTERDMDLRLHKAAKDGNIELLDLIFNQIRREGNRPDVHLHLSGTPQKNTTLHIAARFGHHDVATKILCINPSLLTQLNSNADTPLHLAARAGHLDLVELFTSQRDIENGAANNVSVDSLLLMRMENSEKNTAVHEALSKGHEQVALHLLERDPDLGQFVNEAGESPLYLAVEHQLKEVVTKILSSSSFSKQGPRDQTPLNAAVFARSLAGMSPPSEPSLIEQILMELTSFSQQEPRGRTPSIAAPLARSIEIIEMLIEGSEELMKGVDRFGRTALHCAASTGSSDIVHLLLGKDRALGYVQDKDGFSPLLVAASGNFVGTVGVILDYCLDSIEQLDARGRNALHILVLKNAVVTVKMLSTRSEFKELINEPDHEGNTPLHLAVKNNYQKMVELLVKFEGVNLKAKNKEGFTALDISELSKEAPSNQIFVDPPDVMGKVIRFLLSSHSRFEKVPIRYFLTHHKSARGQHCYLENVIPTFPSQSFGEEPEPESDLKAMANNLTLVATLVATISFAAAFTMPGGYSSDEPHQGMATLIKKLAFKVFVVSDTIAVTFSFLSAYILIKVSYRATERLQLTIGIAEALVTYAVLASMIAFVTGVYVVIYDECKWLAILACCIGCYIPTYLFGLIKICDHKMVPRRRKNYLIRY